MILWREQNWQEVKGYMSFGNLEASVSVRNEKLKKEAIWVVGEN